MRHLSLYDVTVLAHMTAMTSEVSPRVSAAQLKAMDARISSVDEDRWLSSRYAPSKARKTLIVLYAYNYELARVRTVVSDETMGAIRFQWWRDVLSELEDGQMIREHDVALALRDAVESQSLNLTALARILDAHQSAFEAKDRNLEPEYLLASVAASVLTGAHGWGESLRQIAPYYANSRRGESVEFGPIVPPAPTQIRPAIAHFRLRRIYAQGVTPGRLSKRLCVMKGISSGKV